MFTLENNKYKKEINIKYNNKNVAKLSYIMYENEMIVYLDCPSRHKKDIIDLIKENFPDCIIEDPYYNDTMMVENLYTINLTSTYDKDIKYIPFNNLNSYYVCKKENVNKLRDIFENKYFVKEIDYEKLTFINMTQSEFEEYSGKCIQNDEVFGMPSSSNREYGSNYNIAGFHYFQRPTWFENQNVNYLLCMQNNNMLGVIKYGVYGQAEQKHQTINYIDTNIAYRNKGIATLLIKELDKHLNPELPLFLTSTSTLGSLCKMEEKFEANIKKVPVIRYDAQEEYYKKIRNNINISNEER